MNRASTEIEVALKSVLQAATLCQRVSNSVTPQALQKSDRSPVTIADFGSQALIARALRNAFPHIPLIAEEDASVLRRDDNRELRSRVREEVATQLGESNLDEDEVLSWIDHGCAEEYSEVFWTLDPIDGTKGFLRREQYAIALALMREGEPVCAVLCCPNLESEGGLGATFVFDGEKTTEQANHGRSSAANVSAQQDLASSRFCESVESGHSDHGLSDAIAKALGIREESLRMDSQAKYAAVARGDAEFYLRLPTRPGYVERIWDHAAGYAILKGAGGTVTDINGKPLDFRHGRGLEKNRGVVASNGPNHDRLVRAVSTALADRENR